MSHYVICYKIEPSGGAYPFYCPGRSDIEMNGKIRSAFRFSSGLRVERSILDVNLEVWYDQNDTWSPLNFYSQALIGKETRGELVVTTRNPKFTSTTSIHQQFLDTDWNRIIVFLKDSRSPSSTTPSTQQQVQAEGVQQRRSYDQSLNTTSNSTSFLTMGTTFSSSAEQKQGSGPVATENAFMGEGAFSYRQPAVQKILPTPKEEEVKVISQDELITLETFGFKADGSQDEEMDRFMEQEEEEDQEGCDSDCGVSAYSSAADQDREEFSAQALHDVQSYYKTSRTRKGGEPDAKTRKVIINGGEGKARVVLKLSSNNFDKGKEEEEEDPQEAPEEDEGDAEYKDDSVLGEMEDDDVEEAQFQPPRHTPSPPRGRRRSSRIRDQQRKRGRQY